MTVVAYGVDHGVDRLLNVVKGYGVRILRLTTPLKTPLSPVLVRLWRCFSLFERCFLLFGVVSYCLALFVDCFALFFYCAGIVLPLLWR